MPQMTGHLQLHSELGMYAEQYMEKCEVINVISLYHYKLTAISDEKNVWASKIRSLITIESAVLSRNGPLCW